jgi:aspartate/glutamate racemase
MVSIVEACATEAQRRDLRRLGLLGTRFTMEGSFYPTVFARRGIAIVSLLLSEPVVADIPALDTTALHVHAIVKRLRAFIARIDAP